MFSRIQISSLTVTEYEFTASVIQFLGVVFVPVGDFDDDVGGAVGDGLAAEARLGGDAGGFVELVEFGVGGFVAGFEALVNDDVAGGAGADAAAGVVKAGFDAFGDVEDAAREAVVAVRNFFRVDLDGFAAGKKGDFVFLRGGFVFDFFDVWVAAAHWFPLILAALTSRQVGAQHAAPLQRKSKPRPTCGLPAPWKRRNSLAIPLGAPSRDSDRRCVCGLICSRCRLRIRAMRLRWLQY